MEKLSPLTDLTGKRVIVCEDEGIMLMQLKRILTQAGLLVVGVADNGETAIDVVRCERPDLVLMDIRMPKMDGLTAAEHILGSQSVCIVMLTAFSEESYRQQAREIGACGYIVKPVVRDNLLPQLMAAYELFRQR